MRDFRDEDDYERSLYRDYNKIFDTSFEGVENEGPSQRNDELKKLKDFLKEKLEAQRRIDRNILTGREQEDGVDHLPANDDGADHPPNNPPQGVPMEGRPPIHANPPPGTQPPGAPPPGNPPPGTPQTATAETEESAFLNVAKSVLQHARENPEIAATLAAGGMNLVNKFMRGVTGRDIPPNLLNMFDVVFNRGNVNVGREVCRARDCHGWGRW
jgi:hypothetical protein